MPKPRDAKNGYIDLFQSPPVDAENTVLAILEIPDTPEYRRMLAGAINSLTKWNNYQLSGTTREATVALQWRNALSTLSFDLCQFVEDCIRNNAGVQDALADNSSARGVPNNNPNDSIGVGDGNLLEGMDCQYDAIYGACVAIEDYISDVATDILEVINDADARWLNIARLVDFMPIVGDLPIIDDVNDIVDWLSSEGLTSYQAGYTATMRQQNICGLFKIACKNCQLTSVEVSTFYGSLGGASFDADTLWRAVALLLVGLTGNTAFAYGMHALVASVFAVGGSINGLGQLIGLQNVARSGEPDGDWALFCDPCQDNWAYLIDFKDNDGGYTNYDGRGAWELGNGWRRGLGTLPSQLGTIQLNSPNYGLASFDYVRITCEGTNGEKYQVDYPQVFGGNLMENFTTAQQSTFNFPSADTTGLFIGRTRNTNTTITGHIVSVEFGGQGNPPPSLQGGNAVPYNP